jgi:2-polyprenyl-3-methyl-5-hydroxy-6-metoxy-1,4-benzoquinol methylase
VLEDFYKNYYRDIYGAKSPKDLFHSQRKNRGSVVFDLVQPHISSDSVLEIGCGAGGILSVFKDAGCEVLGLDFDTRYLSFAQKHGIPVIEGGVESLPEGKKFDCIIVSHVLEHIPYPKIFLESVRQKLKEHGALYVEVPSLNHVGDGGYFYDLRLYFQNAHASHFTVSTLSNLAKASGYNIVSMDRFTRSVWLKSEA